MVGKRVELNAALGQKDYFIKEGERQGKLCRDILTEFMQQLGGYKINNLEAVHNAICAVFSENGIPLEESFKDKLKVIEEAVRTLLLYDMFLRKNSQYKGEIEAELLAGSLQIEHREEDRHTRYAGINIWGSGEAFALVYLYETKPKTIGIVMTLDETRDVNFAFEVKRHQYAIELAFQGSSRKSNWEREL